MTEGMGARFWRMVRTVQAFRGMSDEELAAAAGMHRVTLSRKKSGERATTTADMDAIAAVLTEVRVDVTIDLPFVTDNRQYLTSADPSDQGKGYAA